MLKLVVIHCHGVLIFKKGSMEVDNSIEALGLTLQRGATFSISDEASSFSYEHFLENHACHHTAHRLLPTISPIWVVHLKDQVLLHYKVYYICISIIVTHNVTVVTIFQTWTDHTCFRGCWNRLTDINLLLCILMASWISSASYNIKLECRTPHTATPHENKQTPLIVRNKERTLLLTCWTKVS